MERERIPYFEALACLLSYYLALVCMFNNDMFKQIPEVYGILDKIGNETIFAVIFFSVATINVIGLLINSHMSRIIGLTVSAVIYFVIAVSYAMSAIPLNWGTGVYFLLFGFSILNIFEVKHTRLIEGKKGNIL